MSPLVLSSLALISVLSAGAPVEAPPPQEQQSGECYALVAQANIPAYGTVYKRVATCGSLYEPFSRVYVTAVANTGYKFCGWYQSPQSNVCIGVTTTSCNFIKAPYDEYALGVFAPVSDPCPPM